MAAQQTDQWLPPDSPDPRAILNEAREDHTAGRYHLALAKYVWFHNHALEHSPSLSGVRLSFALADWLKLADEFPPAMTELKQVRERAEARFRRSGGDFAAFHDFASLNRHLGEEARTAEAFKLLDRMDSEAARRVYRLAERALLSQSEYGICGKYIEPEVQLAEAVHAYRITRDHEAQRAPTGRRPPPVARRFFVQDVATLIALVVQDDRHQQAQEVFDAAIGELDDEPFRAALYAAMTGHFPEPWPR